MSLCLRSRLTYLHSHRITPCPYTAYGHCVLLYAVLGSIGSYWLDVVSSGYSQCQHSAIPRAITRIYKELYMLPSSRAMAKASGSTYYYTGKPCKYQHTAKRLTSSGECSECFKVRDKVRSNNPANKKRRQEYQKDYQVRKAEAIREYRKTRRPKHTMTEEQLRRKVRHNARYRAARTQSVPSWYGEWDEFVMLEAISLAAERAECTGIVWHVDHMIPLKAKEVCGLHCAGNIQVIPATLNTHKCNRLLYTEPLEWLKA